LTNCRLYSGRRVDKLLFGLRRRDDDLFFIDRCLVGILIGRTGLLWLLL